MKNLTFALLVAVPAAFGFALAGLPLLPTSVALAQDTLTADQAKTELASAIEQGQYADAEARAAKGLLDTLLKASVDPESALELCFVGLEGKVAAHMEKIAGEEAKKGTSGDALFKKIKEDAKVKAAYAELGGGGE